jgi:hypothetical protein
MENEFVPYELAFKLKALGFDEPCLKWYSSMGKMLDSGKSNQPPLHHACSAPLFQQAFRFFREEWAIDSWIRPNLVIDIPKNYQFLIIEIGYFQNDVIDDEWYNAYEESELACLEKLIEIVERKRAYVTSDRKNK